MLASVLIFPALVHAQSIPAALRAAILLRSLQYEKTFASGSGEATLLVLNGSGGAKDGGEVLGPFKQIAASGAAGRSLKVESSNSDAAADETKKRAPAVIYVASGNEGALADLAKVRGVVIMCGDPALVGRGCLLSVESAGSASRLVVDLGRAEKAGLKFDARMLRLARVIR